jgi:hypothetical protein
MGSRGQGHNPPNANLPASRSDNARAEIRIPACNVNFVDKKVIRGANRGILGDLTTFSAFSLDAALVIERNANLVAGRIYFDLGLCRGNGLVPRPTHRPLNRNARRVRA